MGHGKIVSGGFLALVFALPLQAQQIEGVQIAPAPAEVEGSPDETSEQGAQPRGNEASLFGSAETVSETQLRKIAGREDTSQASYAVQTAGVSSNSVGDHVTTGTAEISGQAFQNMSGLSILNVNTGNNVAINAAMNVNVSISPNP
ncbi:hypothetical protein [Qipengyuania spongiae]|uniref:Uncharacterized protein n=1 Tax=Qipengyuania spongiae TaxID=2909673 RepID=A0ABY5T0Z1_9SPHN|nr:hypothetical protein [Qipengyuania spongiae]UVI38916.1 hypothetical protein L1F33_11805 [Qipengyuania spongiae]